jgi:hypothetical protein
MIKLRDLWTQMTCGCPLGRDYESLSELHSVLGARRVVVDHRQSLVLRVGGRPDGHIEEDGTRLLLLFMVPPVDLLVRLPLLSLRDLALRRLLLVLYGVVHYLG